LIDGEQEVGQLEKSRPGKVRRWLVGSQQELDFERAKHKLEKVKRNFCDFVLKHKIDKQIVLGYLRFLDLDDEKREGCERLVGCFLEEIGSFQKEVEDVFSSLENQSEEEKAARKLIAKKAEEAFRNYVDSVVSEVNKLSDLWLLRKKFYFCKSDVESSRKALIFENYIEKDGLTISPEGKSFLKDSIVGFMLLYFVTSDTFICNPIGHILYLDYVSLVLREFQRIRINSPYESVRVLQFCLYALEDCWYSFF